MSANDRVIYVSGPMTGYPEFNFPAFTAAAAGLREQGWMVVSPHELPGEELNHPWDWYLRRDLGAMMACTDIYLLPGWSQSAGATLEVEVAMRLNFGLYYDDAVPQIERFADSHSCRSHNHALNEAHKRLAQA